MAWSGKVLGGMLGGMVGGPLGVGVGAALGHYLSDREGDGTGSSEGVRGGRDLRVLRLNWHHHGFGPSGPGVRVTPVWRARRHLGRDCQVRVDAGGREFTATVVPDTDDEVCALPEFLVPYADFTGSVRVRIDAGRVAASAADFDLELPSPVRQLGGTGPARVVMALVACARAGGRLFDREDVAFIRHTFLAAYPLDADGVAWLRAWLRALRDADPARLSAEKVANRLARHVDADAVQQVMLWLMRGARERAGRAPSGCAGAGADTPAAMEAWIASFGDHLGVDAAGVGRLWAELDAPSSPGALAAARSVLGVGPDADADTVRTAWRALAHTWHPDRVQAPAAAEEATRRMSEINAAYRLLREA